jgi:hypothetical protein
MATAVAVAVAGLAVVVTAVAVAVAGLAVVVVAAVAVAAADHCGSCRMMHEENRSAYYHKL